MIRIKINCKGPKSFEKFLKNISVLKWTFIIENNRVTILLNVEKNSRKFIEPFSLIKMICDRLEFLSLLLHLSSYRLIRSSPPSKISELTRTKGSTQVTRVTHQVYYAEEIKGITLVCNLWLKLKYFRRKCVFKVKTISFFRRGVLIVAPLPLNFLKTL